MRIGMYKELISVEDLFEDDDLVLMKATYKCNSDYVTELSVGLKSKNGDIIEIIDLGE